MAITTSNTWLSYRTTTGVQTIELTVGVTTTVSGALTVTVKNTALNGVAVWNGVATFSIGIGDNWTDVQVANAIKAQISDPQWSNISKLFNITGTSPKIILQRNSNAEHDSQFAMEILTNSVGVTPVVSTQTATGATFAKLCDIISYPDVGSAPSKLDTTTLSDTKFKTNILNLIESPDLIFEAYYDKNTYNTIKGLVNDVNTNPVRLQLRMGNEGRFYWLGHFNIHALSGKVDEVRKMQISVTNSRLIYFETIAY